LSARTRTAGPPALTMGSIARTIPCLSTGPCPGCPKLGICGSSWSWRPMPLHGSAYIPQPSSEPGLVNGKLQ
jgi:hypothetical protein